MNFHMDRNKDSFNAYKTLYKGMPWELFDFENLGNDANGYFVRLKKKEQLEKRGERISR